jgi:hypothetical protein
VLPKQLIGAALLASMIATSAVADSDGYFCIGSNYLAYEVGIGGHGSHELHIVSLEPPLGELSRRSLRLPNFQVHGIHCSDAEVLLLGWTDLYVVPDPVTDDLGYRTEALAYGGYRPAPFIGSQDAKNLGSVAREQIIPVLTDRASFFLVTRLYPSSRECEVYVRSFLEQADHEGRTLATLDLYDGIQGTECGR